MIVRSILAAALLASLTASAAQAGSDFDVTGTWEGTISCKGLTAAGEPIKASTAVEIAMSQSGSIVTATIFPATGMSTAGPSPRGIDGLPACGFAFGLAEKPGTGIMNFSAAAATFFSGKGSLDTIPAEMNVSAKLFAANSKGSSGKGKGSAIFDGLLSQHIEFEPTLGSCKLKLGRTSDADPVIDPSLVNYCAVIVDSFLP